MGSVTLEGVCKAFGSLVIISRAELGIRRRRHRAAAVNPARIHRLDRQGQAID